MVSEYEIEGEKERDRGVLSPSDREALLLSEEEYLKTHSRQALSQRKKAIRNRTRNALKDMDLLYEHLDEKTLYSIFYRNSRGELGKDDQDRPTNRDEAREQRDAIRGTLALLLWGTIPQQRFRHAILNRRGLKSTSFGEVLEGAIKTVGIRFGVLVDEIEPMTLRGRMAPGVEDVLQRAREGKELRASEIELLRKSGRVDEQKLVEAIQEAVKEKD